MFLLFLFIIGLAIGSFLNVLIDRLPNEESITGRSHCDHCKKKLTWKDLFPVFSFVYLAGRCRYCGKKLSYFYPMVELLTGVIFVLIGNYWLNVSIPEGNVLFDSLLSLHVGYLQLIALLGIICCCIVIFFSDLKYQIIPDSIQLLFFTFSFLFIVTQGLSPKMFLDHVIAALIVMLPILLLFLVTKTKGMGFGDVKLAFTMGFLLGLIGGFIALYIGFISGAVVGLGLIISKQKKMRSKIAFGPFLILGLITVLFWHQNLMMLFKKFYFFY